MARIESVERLRELLGEPGALVRSKFHEALTEQAIAFIARAPMLFLATARADGTPAVSPKGDSPGFVHVEDPRTLLLPERKGNKLIFSLQNILANSAVELIFLVPGTGETLRVAGHAELDDDAGLCARFIEHGRPALLVTRIHLHRCYFHCAKAFLRSRLWQPQSWSRTALRVSFGREIAQAGGLAAADVDAFDQGVHERYRTDL
ncbi:MAG: pyridoxamine 5'-phosphate oxidase family protein [Burkholderiales bacterium]|nr:pyridoxamine 5'-phosphate oxidase family protein [Burkholderiales bacterium]